MRPPARLLVLVACLLALVGFGGCGSHKSGSALDSSLSYLPKDAPLVLAIDTDVDGDQIKTLDTLVKSLPFGEQIKNALLKRLASGATGVDLDEDVVPLLGNPFVVGSADAKSFFGGADGHGFVAAIKVTDEGKLNDLIEKTKPAAKGERAGAKIYEVSGTEFAVDGDTAVFAGSGELLNAALDRHDGDDHFDEARFKSSLEGVGDDGIAQAYIDVRSLLAGSPGARDALKVKWIGAIENVGINAKLRNDGVDIDFRVHTDPDGLSDADLPIAPGPEAPDIIRRPGEIGVGVRNIGQIVTFVETVAQAVDPSGYGDYAAAKSQIEKRLGVDIQKDLLDQLSGDISASISLNGKFGVRVEPKDPAAFERTLAKISSALPALAKGVGLGDMTLVKPKPGEDFYALAEPGGTNIVLGVKKGVFVLTNDAARADSLALDAPTKATGAKGAVVAQADGRRLADRLLEKLKSFLPIPEQLRPAFTAPLGDLTGWLNADTSGVSGKITLEIK